MNATHVLLHVDNPAASAAFYERVLGRKPLESSPTFALFKAQDHLLLGLWLRGAVEPKAAGAGGCAEIAFAVADAAAVDRQHATWRDLGLTILQPPADMDFGRCFVALDPDGHRLRVMALAE